MITKLMYAALAAALLTPVPALAGDYYGSGDYGAGPYEDYDGYVPVVRKKIIVERPVVIHKRVVIERPVVVERPLVVERPIIVRKRVFVERPAFVERRRFVVERPFRYGKRYYGKHFHGGYGRHFDDDDGDFGQRAPY